MLFQGSNANKWSRILSYFFIVIVGVLFIFIEVYLFQAIFNKIKEVNGATSSYFTLFLFIISVFMTVFCLFTAKKLFFNEVDNMKLQALPISEGKIVASKLFFLFFSTYFMNLVFSLPLFITYGTIFSKSYVFYFYSLFYPFVLFFFQAGVALILVYPYKLFLDFLKKHLVIQFIVVAVIAFGLTYLYSQALNLFISLVSNNNIAYLFTTDMIDSITRASRFMIPINTLEDAFVNYNLPSLFISLVVSLGVFTIGVALAVYFYNKFLQVVFNTTPNPNAERELKQTTPVKALIKKELVILFRDSNFIFSFTGLLIVEPFLSFLIIKGINSVFGSGSISIYLAAVPNIMSFLDITLMLLTSAIIFQGANSYITNENKNVRLMKFIPIKIFTQLSIKVLIPLLLSLFFLIFSYSVLIIGAVIPLPTFLYGLLMNILYIIVLSIVSLYEELHIKRNQSKNSFVSTLYTYLVPLIFFVFALLCSYNRISYHYTFLIGIGVILLSSLPLLINFKQRIINNFLSLEISN